MRGFARNRSGAADAASPRASRFSCGLTARRPRPRWLRRCRRDRRRRSPTQRSPAHLRRRRPADARADRGLAARLAGRRPRGLDRLHRLHLGACRTPSAIPAGRSTSWSGVTPDAKIAGAELMRHNEPVLTLGISTEDIAAYVSGFAGRRSHPRAGDRLRGALGPARRDRAGDGLDRRDPRRDPAHRAHPGARPRPRRRRRRRHRPGRPSPRATGTRSPPRARSPTPTVTMAEAREALAGAAPPLTGERRLPRPLGRAARPADDRAQPARPAALHPRARRARSRRRGALRRLARAAFAPRRGLAPLGRLRPDRGDPGRRDARAHRRRLPAGRPARRRRRAGAEGDQRLPPARRPLRPDRAVPRRGDGHPRRPRRRRGRDDHPARLPPARGLPAAARAARGRAALGVGLAGQARRRSPAWASC